MNSTIVSYTLGFILSISLTLAAYFTVAEHMLGVVSSISAILLFAIVQLIVQLFFFLHLRKGWNLLFLFSTVCIIFLLVVSSLWIMNHLNTMMMVPNLQNQQQYLINQP